MSKQSFRYVAKQNGNKHYMSDKPCKRGHLSLRITSTGTCTECKKILERGRYYLDLTKTKEKVQKKYQANAEKLRAKRRAAYARNPEPEKTISKIRSAEWRRLNPNHEGTKIAKQLYSQSPQGKVRAYINCAKRRASKLQRTPKWLNEIDFERIENEYRLAALLTKVTRSPWHVDHVIPLQGKFVSGLHVPSNLRVLQASENIAKANKYLPKG